MKIFNEKDIEQTAKKFIDDVKDDFEKVVFGKIYDRLEDYIYEHYSNASDKIEGELISKLADEYVQNPKEYKYEAIRKKLFEENKETIVENLQNHAILKTVESIILDYSNTDYYFNWQWHKGITDIIMENLYTLLERGVENKLLEELRILKRNNELLQKRINVLEEEYE